MSTWQNALLELMREVFEGERAPNSGTWFVEGSESIFEAVDNTSAENASRHVGSGVSTLAAHADHAAYYMSFANAVARNQPFEADWAASWARQQVTADTWDEIRSNLRTQYTLIREAMAGPLPDDDDVVTGAIAVLAHCAFHLGAMRQIVNMVRANSAGNA